MVSEIDKRIKNNAYNVQLCKIFNIKELPSDPQQYDWLSLDCSEGLCLAVVINKEGISHYCFLPVNDINNFKEMYKKMLSAL